MPIQNWTIVRLLDPVGSVANPGPPQDVTWRPQADVRKVRRKPVPLIEDVVFDTAPPKHAVRRSISERPSTWIARAHSRDAFDPAPPTPLAMVLSGATGPRSRGVLPPTPDPAGVRHTAAGTQKLASAESPSAASAGHPPRPLRRMSTLVQRLFVPESRS